MNCLSVVSINTLFDIYFNFVWFVDKLFYIFDSDFLFFNNFYLILELKKVFRYNFGLYAEFYFD